MNTIAMNNNNFVKIKKIERELMNQLHDKFIGIEVLAKKYQISPTKLKLDFKLIYGASIFVYFQKHKKTKN